MLEIKLDDKVIKDIPSSSYLSRLTWKDLQKYSYLRLGWTKETFIYYLLKGIENDVKLRQQFEERFTE